MDLSKEKSLNVGMLCWKCRWRLETRCLLGDNSHGVSYVTFPLLPIGKHSDNNLKPFEHAQHCHSANVGSLQDSL